LIESGERRRLASLFSLYLLLAMRAPECPMQFGAELAQLLKLILEQFRFLPSRRVALQSGKMLLNVLCHQISVARSLLNGLWILLALTVLLHLLCRRAKGLLRVLEMALQMDDIILTGS